MTANLEALARALYNGCGWTSFAHNLTLSASPRPTWEEADGEMKAAFRHVARAACEHFGKDADGNVIVPEEGAVAKAREALEYLLDNDTIYSSIGVEMVEDALRALGGK